tara:strand:+ start:245 stop:409 length:165 start_codon:yes stop_codon:yes gene_type:complete
MARLALRILSREGFKLVRISVLVAVLLDNVALAIIIQGDTAFAERASMLALSHA